MAKGTEEIKYKIHIMKALGWYISIHGDIKKNEIAKKMNVDAAIISRETIAPKIAAGIDETNYNQSNKRPIEIERALEMCRCMETTLENVLYYYQFRNVSEISTKIDKLEKLTNVLTKPEVEEGRSIFNDEVDFWYQDVKTDVGDAAQINNLITNVRHPDFKPWFGKYYCYFSSTSSDEAGKRYTEEFDRSNCDSELAELFDCMTEEYIFCGIMDIHNGDGFRDGLCHVDFKFLANAKERIVKRYSGILTLSSKTKAVFCELASNEQGEKSYLIFEKQDLGNAQPHVQSCMAMVLTYSSKVHRRRPCCERMIISSSCIKSGTEEYEVMKAYLRMNDRMIRITDWGYEQLIKDIHKSDDPDLLKIAECFPDLQSLAGKTVTIENCAFIPESVIYALRMLSRLQQRKFEILLRNHSIAPWYYKTKATKVDELFKKFDDSICL